jgi:Protein of unknown function (DUF3618)
MGSGTQLDEIRRQIDESRANLGAAVGALAYKADIKNRGKDVLEDKKEKVMEKVEDLKSKLPGGDGQGVGEAIKAKLPDGDALKSKLPSGEDVSQKVDALKSKLPDGVGDAAGRIGDATPSAQDVKATASEHPLAVVAGAAAAGLAVGLALPETELERQKLAPTAQKIREQVQTRAQEIIEQVKDGAKDAIDSTADAVRQAGQQKGGKVGEIAEKTADTAQEQL